MDKSHSRYPYTFSADYIRGLATERHETGLNIPVLSRSQAASIVSGIAEIIGMSHAELSAKIADKFLKEQKP